MLQRLAPASCSSVLRLLDPLHIVVVDPGVGTERQIIYAEIGGQCYLAPNNGVLSALVRDQEPSKLIAIENRQ